MASSNNGAFGGVTNGAPGDNGGNPFNMGAVPGVRAGEVGGMNFGAQIFQHGSGAVPNRDDAAGVVGDSEAWANTFAQFNSDPGERGGKRSKGLDGGRSRSPLVGKSGVRRRTTKSPMVVPKGGGGNGVRQTPTTNGGGGGQENENKRSTVYNENPPGMEEGRKRTRNEEGGGIPTMTGDKGGKGGKGNPNDGGGAGGGQGVTWDQMYGFVMGLAQSYKGGGGQGKGTEKGGKWQELDERQFRRVDKFKGEKDKYKSWLYEVLTGIGRVNSQLQTDLKELLKTYREEELEFKGV